MSEDRPHGWAYNTPPAGRPAASYADGVVTIYVGYGYRAMPIAEAEALIVALAAAVEAGRACHSDR